MSILNATSARNNFFKIIDEALTTHKPITVTGKSGNVIIISEEDYNLIQETMYLCSISGMREKIVKVISMEFPHCE